MIRCGEFSTDQPRAAQDGGGIHPTLVLLACRLIKKKEFALILSIYTLIRHTPTQKKVLKNVCILLKLLNWD